VPIELNEASGSASQAVAQQDEVVLSLAENPTTGYRWELTQSGAGKLELVHDGFVAGAGGNAPGAGGRRVVRFVARGPGQVQIEAVKKRAWETHAAPTETLAFRIVIS